MEYNFDDWWDVDALTVEADLAKRYHIPWSLRGPPEGPDIGRGLLLWRNMKWRATSKMWMNTGGKKKEERAAFYGVGKASGSSTSGAKGSDKGDGGKAAKARKGRKGGSKAGKGRGRN